jgi:hypothetical protein
MAEATSGQVSGLRGQAHTEYGVPGSVNATSGVDCSAATAIMFAFPFGLSCWQPARAGMQKVVNGWHLAGSCQAWQTGRQWRRKRGLLIIRGFPGLTLCCAVALRR